MFLIYDDEKASGEMLYRKLREYDEFALEPIIIVQKREDAEQCINESLKVIFQDIELAENESGIEFVKNLKSKYPDVIIVFVSAYNKYSQEIFKASPDAFILKPFEDEDVARAVTIIKNKLYDKSKGLTLKIGKRVFNINLKEVAYITKCQKDVVFYNENDEVVFQTAYKISDLDGLLPQWFLRSHHSFYVNMKYIKEIRSKAFILSNEKEIPISIKFSDSKDKYMKYLGDSI